MPSETVRVCPACDKPTVRSKTDKPDGRRDDPRPFACNSCGAHFDEPIIRERRSVGGPSRRGKRLADAEPGDWP